MQCLGTELNFRTDTFDSLTESLSVVEPSVSNTEIERTDWSKAAKCGAKDSTESAIK
jgi:hypothetical protein